MIRLGKKMQYALVALFHLDRVTPGERVNTHSLAEHYDIPEPHLGKVLQRLSRARILRSVQGVTGGYELERSPGDISLGELLEAVNPEKKRSMPQEHHILSLFPACYVQGLAREVERRASAQIEAMRLDELLNEFEDPQTNSKGAPPLMKEVAG